MNGTRAILCAFAGVALLAATSCSASVSAGKRMDEKVLEKSLSRSLEDKTGMKPDKIDCPDDLKGKKGSTMACTLTHGGSERAVTVTVTKVDGLDIDFDYKVASTDKDGSTPGVSAHETELEERVASVLDAQVGHRPDKIDCPGDLPGKVGETMRCTLSAGSDVLGLTLTVTEVKGGSVDFNVNVDEK